MHVAQLGFIGAMGGVILLLVHGLTARSATAARVSAVVFVLVYGAYETWTGIATGALTASAHGLRADEQATAAELIQTHWDSPLLGNGSAGAIAGSAAWLVATVAAALALRGRGAPTGAAVALAGAGVVFTPTHVPQAGPLELITHASWRAVPVFQRLGFRQVEVETVHVGDQVLTRALMRKRL